MFRPFSALPVLFLAATLLAQLPPAAVPSDAPAGPPVPAAPAVQPGKLPASLANRCVVLVNAAGLPTNQMEAIRSFVEGDLRVKVKAVTIQTDWASLPAHMPSFLSSNQVLVVALAKGPAESARILAAPDNRWAIVNVGPLLGLKEKQEQMIKQQTMRGLGLAVGVELCLDPYCCMRVSRVLADLAGVGNNFCPLTRRQFNSLAPQKGLFPSGIMRPVKKKPAVKVESAPVTL
ncbi:MAG: hypothetical protein R6X19_01255 [Kiritimatiellia bacterium]